MKSYETEKVHKCWFNNPEGLIELKAQSPFLTAENLKRNIMTDGRFKGGVLCDVAMSITS